MLSSLWGLVACYAFALSAAAGKVHAVAPATPAPASAPAAPLTIRHFTFVIQHAWIHGKTMVTANGTVPGPTLEVNEGDYVIVDVHNQMANQSTTVHWHGMFQHLTPQSDGVLGLSQCPIAPGDHFTYRFVAAPSGTFWYHGHAHGQYTDGLYGPLIIGRAGGEVYSYEDDVTVMIADWYQLQYGQMLPWFLSAESDSVEPLPDAISLNGVFSRQLSIAGSRSRLMRLRFINSASLSMYRVSIDGMPLQVIEIDGEATHPYEIDRVHLNVAQRVSVLLNFTQAQNISSSNNALYIRVEAATDMYPVNYTEFDPPYHANYTFQPEALAVITLDEIGAQPSYSHIPIIHTNHTWNDDANMLDVRPYDWFPGSIPAATRTLQLNVTFTPNEWNETKAHFNDISYNATYYETEPITPILYQARNNVSVLSVVGSSSVSSVGVYNFEYGEVVDLIIMNFDEGEHPFHLHGMSLWVLSTSSYPLAASLHAGAWLKRDVVSVPPAVVEPTGTTAPGWAHVRFQANNPGVWIFHCHIEWHVSQGLAAWFSTAPEYLSVLDVPSQDHARVCNNYHTYVNGGAGGPPSNTPTGSAVSSSDYVVSRSGVIGVVVGVVVLLLVCVCIGYVCGARVAGAGGGGGASSGARPILTLSDVDIPERSRSGTGASSQEQYHTV